MASEKRICAILYADVVGSSQIKGDIFKGHVANLVRTLKDQASVSDGILRANTWGDGLMLIGSTATVLAEEALRILSRVKLEDWGSKGFPEPVQIRIGLDMNSIDLVFEDGRVIDASGQGMDRASRVEPKVQANRIWCTPAFTQILDAEGAANISMKSVGEIMLAKNAGITELFDLHRPNDAPLSDGNPPLSSNPNKTLRTPRVRREITDRDRDNFLRDAFVMILSEFEKAADNVTREYDDVDASIQKVHAYKFICDVYVNGKSVNKCKVWLSQGSYPEGILYSEGNFRIDSDNSCNEQLNVDDDGHDLFLRPNGMRSFTNNRDEQLNAFEAANFLWEVFVERLEQ